ncbi:hypothetical protein [Magnetospirillum moscoviense]|uniref:Uncharacterized protein n=1 Tax=Magnetospirillum moscoviense TaxID=1437059 RepID=A0A178MYT0_9PROT|nr:hypothetical protein [Magnetospirillum moscoviense]OAN55014.1 hypothetical protein A6A05_00190 [Magnetospirillum moscoviense]
MLPVLRAASCRAGWRVTVTAAMPAFEVLRAAGIEVVAAPSEEGEVLAFAAELVRSCRPDAILSGLSGQGRGIDEALAAAAGAIPTFALQDYPGDVNPGWGPVASTFLVGDAESARLTHKEVPGSQTRIVGNVRFGALAAAADPMAMRAAARARLGVADDRPVVGFYGQFLEIDGYWRTLSTLGEALRAVLPGALVVLRPHPKEEDARRLRAMELLAGGLETILDPLESEESVCAADVATTCFSTSLNILNYFNRVSPRPMGVGLYLLMDAELVTWYHTYNRPDRPPLAELALECREARTLPDLLTKAASALEATRLWTETNRVLAAPADVADSVLEIVSAGGRP